MLHAFLRRGAAVWLSFMLAIPAGILPAATPAPVGTLGSEGTVYLGGQAVQASTVVYSGDQLRTEEGKATLALLKGDLVVLDRNSAAGFARSHESLTIDLQAGRLAFASSAAGTVRVLADGLGLSPADSFPSLAEIALLADGSVRVAVHRGHISVTNLRAEPVVVSAGQLLTVNPRLAQAEKSKPIGTGAHGKMTLGEKLRTFRIGGLSHGTSVVIVSGVIAATAVTSVAVPLVVGDEEPVSPSAP